MKIATKPIKQAVIGTCVLLLSVNFLSPGYTFGYGEQLLLSVKGISWADKNAFVGDWFNSKALQPHILFDAITFVGEKLQFLSGIYLAYYIFSCFIFALSTSLLAEKWLPVKFQYLQHFVNILAVIGPTFMLGTFLSIHFQAVPNMAGGCLLYLSLSLLITERDNWATVAIISTSLFHLQHGIAIAAISILFVVLGLSTKKIAMLVAAMTSLFISFGIALYRDILSGSSEIAKQAAEIGSTGHLNVETWTWPVIRWGIVILTMGVLNFALSGTHRHRVRIVLCFAFVALGPVSGIISDLNNIEPFQSMARSYFVYRFSMAVAPFACWFIVRQLVISLQQKWWRLLLSMLVLFLSFKFYLSAPYVALHQARSWWVLAGLGFLGLALRFYERMPSSRTLGLVRISGVYVAIAIFTIGFATYSQRLPQIDYSANDNAVIISRSMSTALGTSDVLAADPSIPWLRLLTRRALVVDCKGVPYGGKTWNEYLRRLNELGVQKPNVCQGFKQLSLSRILTLNRTVGATTVLLLPDDEAYQSAVKTLKVRWSSGGDNPWMIFELPIHNAEGI